MRYLPRAAVSTAFSVICKTRADRWLGRFTRGVGLVFTLHRVRPERPDDFQPNRSLEISPSFLSILIDEVREAGLDFVPIDEALTSMSAGRRGTRPFVVLTFDDGYRDNLEFAAPILTAKGVPWTVFVVPDFLDGRGRLWWIEIEEALARLSEICVGGNCFDCRTPRSKWQTFDRLRRLCHSFDEDARAKLCDRLTKDAGLDAGRLVPNHCLNWDEMAKAWIANDLTVGSHTESHAILSRCSHDELHRQVASSKRRLEMRLRRRIVHLAYPHGATSDKAHREFPVARDAGYVAAWTTRPAHLTPQSYRHAPYALPRVTINGFHANRAMLRAVLSGIPFVGGSG